MRPFAPWIHRSFAGVAFVAAGMHAWWDAAGPTLALAGALAVGVTGASTWRLRAVDARAPLAVTVGLAAWWPLFVLASVGIVSAPVAMEVRAAVVDQRESGVFFAGLALVALLVAWRSGAALAQRMYGALTRIGPATYLRVSVVLAALTTVAGGAAAVRASRHPSVLSPTRDAPVVLRVMPAAATHTAGVAIPGARAPLHARCSDADCTLRMGADAPDTSTAPWVRATRPLTVRAWPGGALWFVESDDGTRLAFRPAESPLPVPVGVMEVAPRLATPWGWIVGAWVGAALSVAMVLRTRRRARAFDPAAWRDAVLAQATVTFPDEDDRSVIIAPGLIPRDGAVIVRRAALDAQGSAYRGAGLRFEDVREGTLAEHSAAHDADVICGHALAGVMAALSSAPLVASGLCHLW